MILFVFFGATPPLARSERWGPLVPVAYSPRNDPILYAVRFTLLLCNVLVGNTDVLEDPPADLHRV